MGTPIKPFKRAGEGGFTLIELTAVVVIMGLLTTVVVPKFGETLRRSQEGSSKGNLGAIRSALKIYYGEMEGQYPTDMVALTVSSKYLRRIPKAKIPSYHGDSSAVALLTAADDAGGWAYDNVAADANYGTVWVNCTHTDSKSKVWTNY